MGGKDGGVMRKGGGNEGTREGEKESCVNDVILRTIVGFIATSTITTNTYTNTTNNITTITTTTITTTTITTSCYYFKQTNKLFIPG